MLNLQMITVTKNINTTNGGLTMSNEYGLRKRSHQKWFAGLTLLLSFMLVLSGCGVGKDGQGGSSGDGGKVTLKMMHLW